MPVKKIRWLTWWPVPYWTERFNSLACREGIELEVIFLSSSSLLLPVSANERSWKFEYKIVRNERAVTGYGSVHTRWPRPLPLLVGEYDLLIMPYGDPDFVMASFMCAMTRKPYFIFSPNNDFEQRKVSRFREYLKRFIYSRASGVLATGPHQKQYALKYTSKAERVYVVGNPSPPLVDLHRFRCRRGKFLAREELGWQGQFIILYVGRLSEEKGLYTLVDAIAILNDRGVNARAVLVGSGPCAGDLKSYIELKDANVQMMGFTEGAGLTKIYIAADVFVLPSFSEAWGLVVNEAMEAGLPVIVSDKVGAQEALVRNDLNGRVFPAGSADMLAQNIMYMYRNRDLLSNMSESASQVIKNHTIESWVDNVVHAVDGLTGQ